MVTLWLTTILVSASEAPPIQQVLLVDNDNKIVTFGFLLLR